VENSKGVTELTASTGLPIN